MFNQIICIAALLSFAGIVNSLDKVKNDNIEGTYAVKKGLHYSNKTTVTWGMNSQKSWYTIASLSLAAATYNSSETCDDPAWYYDWNKLWGKARCGYFHGHHQDSDRFVFRRCSDPTCASYIPGTQRIEIATYSYDNGIKPYEYPQPNPTVLQPFAITIEPYVPYKFSIDLDEKGASIFSLSTIDGKLLETHTVLHTITCTDNYFEGVVDGLYFGGDCRAPEDLVVTYSL